MLTYDLQYHNWDKQILVPDHIEWNLIENVYCFNHKNAVEFMICRAMTILILVEVSRWVNSLAPGRCQSISYKVIFKHFVVSDI